MKAFKELLVEKLKINKHNPISDYGYIDSLEPGSREFCFVDYSIEKPGRNSNINCYLSKITILPAVCQSPYPPECGKLPRLPEGCTGAAGSQAPHTAQSAGNRPR